MSDGELHRDFPGRVLVLNLFRVGHVAGLAGVSAWVFAPTQEAAQVVHGAAFAFLLVASGLGILALDAWSNRQHFRQINGLAMLLKLALVALMATAETWRVPLFWTILAYSVAISHAPGRIRHRKVI